MKDRGRVRIRWINCNLRVAGAESSTPQISRDWGIAESLPQAPKEVLLSSWDEAGGLVERDSRRPTGVRFELKFAVAGIPGGTFQAVH